MKHIDGSSLHVQCQAGAQPHGCTSWILDVSDSTFVVCARATSAWPEAVQELVPDMDWRATPLPETGAPGPEQAEADACMLYSSSPGIDSHQITSPSPGGSLKLAVLQWQ